MGFNLKLTYNFLGFDPQTRKMQNLLILASSTLARLLKELEGALGDPCLYVASSIDELFKQAPTGNSIFLLDADVCISVLDTTIKQLHKFNLKAPIILICDKNTPMTNLAIRLERPFKLQELRLIIEQCCRLTQLNHQTEEDHKISLNFTEKEEAIMINLIKAQGACVNKPTLLNEIWGYAPNVTTRTLETHISRLRHKISSTPNSPWLLVTDEDGYRLIQREITAMNDTARDI